MTTEQIKPKYNNIYKYENGKLYRNCKEYSETIRVKGDKTEEEIKEILKKCKDEWNEDTMEKVKIVEENWYWIPTKEEFINI